MRHRKAAPSSAPILPRLCQLFFFAALVFVVFTGGLLVGSRASGPIERAIARQPWSVFTQQRRTAPRGAVDADGSAGGDEQEDGAQARWGGGGGGEADADDGAGSARLRAPQARRAAARRLPPAQPPAPIGEVAPPRAAPPPPPPAAAAAAAPGTPGAPVEFGTFHKGELVELSGPADGEDISFGAWIFVDGADASSSIRTIASNRYGGCDNDDLHRGYSFYVNNWETQDRALVLEWRDGRGSCGRLSSEMGTVPLDAWVHVGFGFRAPAPGTPGAAMLFLGGSLLRTMPCDRGAADAQVGPDSVPLTIGATADRQYGFSGRIAHVFLVAGVITPKQLAAAVRLSDIDGWTQMAAAAKDRLLLHLILASRPVPGLADRAASSAQTEAGVLAAEFTGKVVIMARASMRDKPRSVREEVPPAVAAVAAAGVKKAAPGGGGGGSKKRPVPALEDNGRLVPKFPDDDTSAPAAAGGAVRKPVVAPRKQAAAAAAAPAPASDRTPAGLIRGPLSGRLPAGAFDFRGGGNQWVTNLLKLPAHLATGRRGDAAAFAAGTWADDLSLDDLARSDELGRERALAVKAAMQHAWKGYVDKAWGADELKPRSGGRSENWSGLGMTLVDSLDTLFVMGMMEEFDAAGRWVADNLRFDRGGSISVFEVTIRELGGLLAAYDLSGDAMFLGKAKDLGERLLPAFNTATGIPRATISLSTGDSQAPGWTGGAAILAELGTCQVEHRYLSAATGEDRFARKAEAVIERMAGLKPPHGLYPIFISAENGQPTTGQVTFGALGDSFYEYLLKVWLQGGRSEDMYRTMYDAAMDGMASKLLKRSRPSNLLYVSDWDGANNADKMDHLVCFVPGMLALGAATAAGTPGEANAARDLQNARALAYTCWQMYERMATGIAAEYVEFPGGGDLIAAPNAAFYILRPEAAESMYILHQLTGDPIYREWGWAMFSAIEKHCRTEFGYGAHPDVRDVSRSPDDRMESFFLAETLKYLYMLQSPDHPISLERYVFNTEAHPMRVFSEMDARS